MAKKKKPVANPNRGFATTSIASKQKPDKASTAGTSTPDATVAKDDGKNSDDLGPSTSHQEQQSDQVSIQQKELHELSPDELEKRLEDAELQRLVEKYSAKTSRDVSRHASKLQTDCRVLRKQAQPLYTRALLPDELMWQILDLARSEIASSDSNNSSILASPGHGSPEEDLTSQVWTLQRSLLAMGFTAEQAEKAVDHVLASTAVQNPAALMWGQDQAIDWLLLNEDDVDLPRIDDRTGQPVRKIEHQPELLPPSEDVSDAQSSSQLGSSKDPPKSAIHKHKQSEPTDTPPSSNEEFDVSDLESDMEPDGLLSSYLSAKARLFEAQPDLVDQTPRKAKSKTNVRNRPGPQASGSPSIKKLQQKMEKIESDMLFDQYEADVQWISKRNRLAQEAAGKRRLNATPPERRPAPSPKPASPPQTSRGSNVDQTNENKGKADEDDDDTAIGDLFGAEPSSQPVPASSGGADASSDIVTSIRDFGQPPGISPRRVLEEACRARDSGVRLTYKLISFTAFSNRHTLMITWSKDQDFALPLQLEDTTSQASTRQCSFTMKTAATPDARQSEGYVSVVALFQLFSTSVKEEKTYLRLPPVWRDFYLEMQARHKAVVEAEERETVRHFRDKVRKLVDAQPEDEVEDVVYTRNFRKRNEEAERSRSRHAQGEQMQVAPEQLQEIWRLKSSTPAYQHMLSARMNLPMFQFRDAALEAVDNNQVTIICGETGCGKSTQMPSFILEHQLKLGKACKIYCTEPRRISAITLAQRVSQELGEAKADIGTMRSLIGYAIRLESQTSRSTRLVYATTGIVLRMLESGDSLKEVTHIVIDEVHERTIETDFLLIILRTLMIKRPELKVVLMSATVDAERFSAYFNRAPVLTVPGRTFPVEQKFLEDAIQATGHVVSEDDQSNLDEADLEEPTEQDTLGQSSHNADYLKQYSPSTRRTLSKYNEYRLDYDLIVKLVNIIAFSADYQQYSQAMLVFLPGIAEIRALSDMLSGTPLARQFVIFPLHSAIPSEDQQRAFEPPPRGMRKIVISTNIAETGVTIPDVTCVIDTGKHKEMRFDERRQISRLVESFISRANAKQRRGRAGRVQAGLCFHLFTRQRHDNVMSGEQTPEMLRLSLQDLVMRVKICKLGDIQTTLADALDPPSAKNVRRAIDALTEVDALTSSEELTPLGQQLSKLPLDPYLGKLVLYGALFACLDVALTLAALLTSKSPFSAPMNARASADAARAAFARGESDLLTDYNAYASWRRVCTMNPQHESQFCRRNFLSSLNLSNIEDLKAQLLGSLAEGGVVNMAPQERSTLSRIQNSSRGGRRNFVQVPESLDRYTLDRGHFELISAVIAWSFYPKLLTREGKGWRNVGTSQAITVHPTSVLRSSHISLDNFNRVKYLSFYSIMQSSGGAKNYNASSLTPVAPLELVLLAGEATFLTYAGVISIDSSRLRFVIETREAKPGADGQPPPGIWKTMTALKYLRRKMEETVEWQWQKPGKDLPARLTKWWALWEKLVSEVWVKKD